MFLSLSIDYFASIYNLISISLKLCYFVSAILQNSENTRRFCFVLKHNFFISSFCSNHEVIISSQNVYFSLFIINLPLFNVNWSFLFQIIFFIIKIFIKLSAPRTEKEKCTIVMYTIFHPNPHTHIITEDDNISKYVVERW